MASTSDQDGYPHLLQIGDAHDPSGLTSGDAAAVERAADLLQRGESVVIPTDTVYGLAALPGVPGATAALFDLKGRDSRQPLAVLVADTAQALELADLAQLLPNDATLVQRVAQQAWPGALTFVLPRRVDAYDLELGGSPSTIGLRCPASGIVRALAARVGPIAVTSANLTGEPTPATAVDAARLRGQVALILDAGELSGQPSTVVAVSEDGWIVLRTGPVDVAMLGAPLPFSPPAASPSSNGQVGRP